MIVEKKKKKGNINLNEIEFRIESRIRGVLKSD